MAAPPWCREVERNASILLRGDEISIAGFRKNCSGAKLLPMRSPLSENSLYFSPISAEQIGALDVSDISDIMKHRSAQIAMMEEYGMFAIHKKRDGMWYIYSPDPTDGRKKTERCFPDCRSKPELHERLREELGLAEGARVFEAMGCFTWSGEEWINDEEQTLGARLRRFRLLRGLSLDALAASCGVSKQMLSDVERGASEITVGKLRAVADILELSLDELVPPTRAIGR